MPTSLTDAGVTAREAEVLDALGSRLTNAEVAERLFISVRTVESHVSALLRKLGEPDRRALAARARALLEPARSAFPPTLADAAADGPFLGRESELARLLALSERAGAKAIRHGVLVCGEAGIGKTRLAAEVAARLHETGAVVIHGRCQHDTLVPYQAFIDATERLPRRGTAEPLAPPGDSGGAGPTSARYRLFEEFDNLLTSQRTLVVFVLDDVQWIDPSGLQLLRHLLHHVDRSALVVLATGRPETTDPGHALAAVLASGSGLEIVTLAGLTLAEAEALAGARGDASHARVAWERGGGNPFLITELLRHTDPAGELPPAARDAIVRRVAGLGSAVFDVLTAAAVAGDVFHLDLVSSALGGDRVTHAAALDRAFGAGVICEDRARRGGHRFAHAIVREALEAVTSPARRSRLHQQMAGALEAMGPAMAPDAARHRHAALPDGDTELTRLAALSAFDHAMNSLAYEVAVSFADMALDAITAGGGGEPERAEAILRRGQAHIRAGVLDRGVADCRLAFEVASRHDLARLRAHAVLAWAEASPLWGRQPDLQATIEHTLTRGVDDLALRAQLEARLAQLLYYEDAHDRRAALSRVAVEHARQSGRADALAAVLAATHVALWDPTHLDQRTAVAKEIVAIATVAGQPELELQGRGWLAVDLLETGALAAADDALARHATLAERLHQRLALRDVELWAAMRSLLGGSFDTAAGHIERARDLGEAARDPSTETVYWVQRYWLAVERGDQAEMDNAVEPCERIARDNADVPAWRAALALLHARRGDPDTAQRHYELLTADQFRSIPLDIVWLNAMTYLAETCSILGDREGATFLMNALTPYAGRMALIDRGLACKGAVHRFLGLLAATAGDLESASRHLRHALAQHESMAARPLLERTRREHDSLRP